MRIEVDNVYGTLLDKDGWQLVYDYLSFRPEGFQFMKAYKNKHWDGWRHIMGANNRFPAGLTADVRQLLMRNGIEVEVIDKRVRPEAHPLLQDLTLSWELEEHQKRAVFAIGEKGRGVVHHPTGSGKSVVIVAGVRKLAVPTLVLVKAKALLHQQAAQFVEGLGRRDVVGIVGDGEWEPSLITVATVQTLMAKMRMLGAHREMAEWMKQWQAVLIDECHHLPAASYEKLMNMAVNAYYRLGFSATPHRSGEKGQELMVTGFTGPIISQEGFIVERQVPVDIFVVPPGGYKAPKNVSYAEEVDLGIVKNVARNELIVQTAESWGDIGPTVILTERIEHGERLRDLLGDAGHEEVS